MPPSDTAPEATAGALGDLSAGCAGHDAPLDYHRRLLDDPLRMDAYERALRQRIRPGATVLDLGAGSGILAMLAARCGAARVYAVESMPIAGLARQLVAANGLEDRVLVLQRDLRQMEPAAQVDLIVSDFMGRFLVDDEMLPVVERAAGWLAPGGSFCPQRVDLFVAPVADLYLRPVQLFEEPFFGLDLSPALPYALNYAYHAALQPAAQCGPARLYGSYEPPAPAPAWDARLRLPIERAGSLQGVVGWFVAHLSESVALDTGPGFETHWGQYLFPLPTTLCAAGDELELWLHLDPAERGSVWRWEATLRRDLQRWPLGRYESEQRLGQRPTPAPGAP